MNHNIKFSIVVPTYNRASLIIETIKSLLNQKYNSFEIIVVDDGSTDNTEEVLKPYLSDRVLYFKKNNAERAAARNYGARIAKGAYINWFDSDDLALPNHLTEADFFCSQLNNPEIFHLAYQFNMSDGELISKFNSFSQTDNQSLILGNNLSCNGVFVRKDIALQNPFNEDRIISASEDYELWLRLAAQFPIYCTNTITSIVIQHDGRSVLTMVDSDKLIKRFTAFLKYVNANKDVVILLGDKLKYFNMKNYLLLAVHLASNGNKNESFLFLKKGCMWSWKFLGEKTFYAIIKHIVFPPKK